MFRFCCTFHKSHKNQLVNKSDPPNDGMPMFTFSKVKRMTNSFERTLGRGSCGVVYYGRLLDGSTEVAVKMLNEEDCEHFIDQIHVFEAIRHKNIVSLLGYCQDETNLALVSEFMNKGDLRGLMSGACSLRWKERLQIAIDTAEGLCYLHEGCDPPMVHGDVKPSNILVQDINGELLAKVADFGQSIILAEKIVGTRVIGTYGYIDPEYFLTFRVNDKTDVYNFGVILLQLITGKTPNHGFNILEWFNANTGDILNMLDPKMVGDVNHISVCKAAEVASSCVNTHAAERPKMSEIIIKLKESLDIEIGGL